MIGWVVIGWVVIGWIVIGWMRFLVPLILVVRVVMPSQVLGPLVLQAVVKNNKKSKLVLSELFLDIFTSIL